MSPPSARLPSEQLSCWLPAEPVIEQPVNAGSSDQFRSAPAGKLSVTETPLRAPGPLLCTVMSNPMSSPAVTGPAGFAVFVTLIVGHWTVMLSCAVRSALLSAFAVATLVYSLQLSFVVGDEM